VSVNYFDSDKTNVIGIGIGDVTGGHATDISKSKSTFSVFVIPLDFRGSFAQLGLK